MLLIYKLTVTFASSVALKTIHNRLMINALFARVLSSIIRLLFYTFMHIRMYVCCRLVGLYVTHVHTQRAFSIFGKIRREQQQ